MTDHVNYQSGTLATPPPATTVATDYKPVGAGGSAHFQRMVLDVGPDGTSVPVAWGGTGIPLGTLPGGSVGVVGTVQGLGTVQPLAGSVHLASGLPGTAQVLGTVRILDPAAVTQSGAWVIGGTVQALGTIQAHGTTQVLGSVGAQGYVAHGAVAAGNPLLLAGFGTSGTPTAVDDQDAVRLWADLNGRLQVRGTIDSLPAVTGTVQPLAGSVHLASSLPGTVQVLGTVQTHGTAQVLGTVRALVDGITVSQGTIPGGTVVVQPLPTAAGTYLSVRLSDGNAFYTASGGGGGGGGIAYSDESSFAAGGSQYTPIGGFVTNDAVPDGSAGAVAMTTARALHVHVPGSILGTVQPLAGSVHLASGLPGTVQVLGTIQAHGTGQIIGTVRTLDPVGTQQVLGTVRALLDAGTVQALGTFQAHGTTQVLGTVAIASVGTVAASLAKREDTTHADGDVGVMILGVRRDEAVTAAADGEYTAISTDSAGRLRVNTGPDLVDDANSSTTPLAGGAAFTGTGIEMTEYASIVVNVFANVASATDGLQIQFSQDNTNWDNAFTATVSASTATSLRQGAIARYVRVVYTNGAGAQATFRLQTILKGSPLSLSGKPVSENLSSTDLSVTTKSVLAGRVDGGNNYRNIETTNTVPTATVYGLITRIAGTPQFLGTVQPHGTTQVLGTVTALPVGTQQVLGTIQAHGTTQALGTVSVQGYAAHDAAVAGNPVLLGAFGSSGAPTAVTEQDAVRLWADLNGRIQVVGSVTTAPTGTQQVLGTVRALIDAGTVQALGSVQTHGTTHVLGSVSLLGAGTLAGGTVRTLPPTGTALGETYFSTIVTATQSAVTYVAAPGAGTFIRVYDILISGSAAGTARLIDNAEGTAIGHIHAAANGGWSFNSSRGIRTRAANRLLAFSCSAGTWGVLINYALET